MLCRFDIQVPDSFEEPLLGLAERLGIQSFSSPLIAESPGGEEDFRFTGETVVSVIFSSIEQNPENIDLNIREFLTAENLPIAMKEIQYSEDEDWMRQFRSYFVPIRVGRSIVIRPPWTEQLPGEKSAITILIDPGMAFGTGTHETTRLCLKFLDKQESFSGTFLDIGAGSGILSFFLLKKGAAKVTAVEMDGPAVENLRKNQELNFPGGMAGLQAICTDLQNFEPRLMVDGLVANITSPVLLANFHRFHCWLKPGAWAIFSGINSANAPAVQQALKHLPFEGMKKSREGEWFAFFVRKNA